ncbi:hypothetical protein F2Q69_00012214 [Brassica cretica]|uniref:Uncharacterized protein n=1 Tax=Brassica cretica TaxID=69181 RepID=A0A8S9QZQ1_BRACR|nr:hypothetical protein F2Q69_00012214 [Brassica cretica]
MGQERSKRQRADGPSDGQIKMDSHGTSYGECEERDSKVDCCSLSSHMGSDRLSDMGERCSKKPRERDGEQQMVEPEINQAVQTGHFGDTSDRGSVQGEYLNNQKVFFHESNFKRRQTHQGINEAWNYKKIFMEEEFINFTNRKFPSPFPESSKSEELAKEKPRCNQFPKTGQTDINLGKFPTNSIWSDPSLFMETMRYSRPFRRHPRRPYMHQHPEDQADSPYHLLSISGHTICIQGKSSPLNEQGPTALFL